MNRPASPHARSHTPTRVRILAAAVGAASLVAACAGSGAAKPTGSRPAASEGGVLRIAYDLSGSAGSQVGFDPTQSHAPGGDIPWEIPIYDSLLHYTTSGALVPSLATSATIMDPRTITVELRVGLRFSDGTPFDANAVKAGILRSKAAAQHGQFNAALQDISSIDVTTPTSLTINMSQPVAGAFYPLLAGPETFIPSPAAAANPSANLNTAPVGAGPYKLKQYIADERIVLVKNPTYWDAKDIHLSEIDFVSIAGGPQQINAVESGTVDLTQVPPSEVAALRSDSSIHIDSQGADNSMLWMPLCKAAAPLNDARVRQALNYAVDREAINQSLLQGAGEPQWALWPMHSVYFPANLENHYAYNPAKARDLLAAAGYAHGFDLKLILQPSTTITTQAAQIIQAEWKQIGVNLALVQSTNFVPDLYVNHVGQTTVLQIVSGGLGKINGPFRPGTIGDLCGYDNPALDAVAAQLNSLSPTSPQAVELWDQAQTLIVDDALAVWIDFLPEITAWTNHVTGANMITSYLLAMPDYHTVNKSS